MKKYFFILAACSLLFCCRHEHQEEPIEDPYELPCGCPDEWPNETPTCRNDLAWDYPVKPDTEEWEQIETHEGRIAVCLIPEDVLSSLSTEELTDVCMQYPLLGVVLAWSPHERGLDSLFYRFNGVRELYKRKDAYKGLLNWYRCAIQNLSFLDKDVPLAEKGSFCSKISITELLLTRCQLPDDADKDNNYKEIMRHLICGYEKTFAYPEYFTYYSFLVNCFSRTKIMMKIEERIIEEIPPEIFYRFLDVDTDVQAIISAIDELSCQFIN